MTAFLLSPRDLDSLAAFFFVLLYRIIFPWACMASSWKAMSFEKLWISVLTPSSVPDNKISRYDFTPLHRKQGFE